MVGLCPTPAIPARPSFNGSESDAVVDDRTGYPSLSALLSGVELLVVGCLSLVRADLTLGSMLVLLTITTTL